MELPTIPGLLERTHALRARGSLGAVHEADALVPGGLADGDHRVQHGVHGLALGVVVRVLEERIRRVTRSHHRNILRLQVRRKALIDVGGVDDGYGMVVLHQRLHVRDRLARVALGVEPYELDGVTVDPPRAR